MSLVPYQPQEGREIVLRHRNAIVVHDPTSQRLEIRGINLGECPTCHRPLRSSSSPERPHYGGNDSTNRHEGFVDPNYFRLLRAGGFSSGGRSVGAGDGGADRSSGSGGRDGGSASAQAAGANPFRQRLVQPLEGGRSHDTADVAEDAEFVSSTPNTTSTTTNVHSSPISQQAFSPNYFNTFFIEERELGRGGKGVVHLVRHEIDGCVLGHFACKRVPVGDNHAWLEKVLVEVELLAKLSHPNLVSYRHVWLENRTLTRFGPPVACAFILQQYCNGGDLQRYILGEQPKAATKEELKARMRRRSRGGGGGGSSPLVSSPVSDTQQQQPGDGRASSPLAFDEIYSLFKDITSGLAYLHAANYIHRDLKPSNCLLHRGVDGTSSSSSSSSVGGSSGGSSGINNLTCLISDFGEVQAENGVRTSTGTTGTVSYCAPEVLRVDAATGRYGNFTTKSDVFSLGMILYFMCFGRLPYRSANAANEELEDNEQLRREIAAWRGLGRSGGGAFGGAFGGFGGEGRRARTDLPSKLYALLTDMLAVDPNQRPSAVEVLQAMRTTRATMEGGGGSSSAGSTPTMPLSPTASKPSLVSSRRIQNLDSPVPSGSPVPDPSKSKRTSPGLHAAGGGDVDASVFDDSDDARRRTTRRRNGGMPATTTSLALTRSSHSSPSRSPGRDRGRPMHTELSPVRRRGRPYLDDGDAVISNANANAAATGGNTPTATTPPLLMPPPPTYWGELRHQVMVAQYHGSMFVQRHAEAAAFAVRSVLFLMKMLTLSRVCWPYMFQTSAGMVLVALAGLDLGLPRSRGVVVVYDEHGHRQSSSRPSLLCWSWRVSVVALVLHCAVVVVAGRYRVLCTGSRSSSVQFADWMTDRGGG